MRRCRVHRIPPNVRDDDQRPSFGRDARSCRSDLPDGLSEIFSQAGLDSRFAKQPDGQINSLRIGGLGVTGLLTCCRSRRTMSAVRVNADAAMRRPVFGFLPKAYIGDHQRYFYQTAPDVFRTSGLELHWDGPILASWNAASRFHHVFGGVAVACPLPARERQSAISI